MNELALLISASYGFEVADITDSRITSWYNKTSKPRKSVQGLRSLSPTQEAFAENTKRAHFQFAISLTTISLNLPNLNPNLNRWEQDELERVPQFIDIPFGVALVPPVKRFEKYPRYTMTNEKDHLPSNHFEKLLSHVKLYYINALISFYSQFTCRNLIPHWTSHKTRVGMPMIALLHILSLSSPLKNVAITDFLDFLKTLNIWQVASIRSIISIKLSDLAHCT